VPISSPRLPLRFPSTSSQKSATRSAKSLAGVRYRCGPDFQKSGESQRPRAPSPALECFPSSGAHAGVPLLSELAANRRQRRRPSSRRPYHVQPIPSPSTGSNRGRCSRSRDCHSALKAVAPFSSSRSRQNPAGVEPELPRRT
jgi:hypothetical protein